MAEIIVEINQGKLRGKAFKNYHGGQFVGFLGIPYARAPIGELRFKAPQPVERWTGERDATQESGPCCQYDFFSKQTVGTEDCLYLNVFAKKTSPELKPVMVWIHGGGFNSGSNTTVWYGPEVLMTKDIVLVTINYRLGILGFLSLEDPSLEVPGNAGMKDQVLALNWVQENIKNFGGDPKNVTIFGQSAGGAAVHLLLLSPAAKGLFHRAIAMSGSALNPWVWGSRNVLEVAKKLGKEVKTEKEALEVLRNAKLDDLAAVQKSYPDKYTDSSNVREFCPIVEYPNPTAFLSKDPRDLIASGQYNHVPFMTGLLNKEGLVMDLFQINIEQEINNSPEDFVSFELGYKRGTEANKSAATKVKDFYQRDGSDFYDLVTDNMFTKGIVESVENHVKNSYQPIYLYLVSVETKLAFLKTLGQIEKPGVAHGDELSLLFDMKLFEMSCEPGSLEDTSRERMLTLFTNFAKYGDPTPSESELGIKWHPVDDSANLNYLDIGKDLTLQVNPFPERMAFWKTLKLNNKL